MIVRILLVFFLSIFFVNEHRGQDLGRLVINGKITGSDNQKPLQYVLIAVKNHPLGTVSNTDGRFRLVIPSTSAQDSIIFSLMGYSSQTMAIQEIRQMEQVSVQMLENAMELDEVVVTLPDVNLIVAEVSKSLKTTFPSQSFEFEGFYTHL